MATWTDFNEKGRPENRVTITDNQGATLDVPFETEFRLPLPNAKIREPMKLGLSKLQGDQSLTISRFEARGRPAPVFGIGLDANQGVIFARFVVPNGLADKSGILPGDVILEVNGQRLQGVGEAMALLSGVSFGEEAVFSVRRGDKSQEIRVVAE